jgi:hypothetical protein
MFGSGNDRVALEHAAKYAALSAHGAAVDGYRLRAGHERHHRSDFFRSFAAFPTANWDGQWQRTVFPCLLSTRPVVEPFAPQTCQRLQKRSQSASLICANGSKIPKLLIRMSAWGDLLDEGVDARGRVQVGCDAAHVRGMIVRANFFPGGFDALFRAAIHHDAGALRGYRGRDGEPNARGRCAYNRLLSSGDLSPSFLQRPSRIRQRCVSPSTEMLLYSRVASNAA